VNVYFRFSGTWADFWLEIETDGEKKEIYKGDLSEGLRACRRDDGDSSQAPKGWGYLHFVERIERQGDQECFVWDLWLSDGRGGSSGFAVHEVRRGVVLQDPKSTPYAIPSAPGTLVGAEPVKLTGEVTLWERLTHDDTPERKCRQIVRLKCQPVGVRH
jgi:hypothetical protein